MINVSTEFKELMQSRTDFQCNADVEFVDGRTLSLGASAFTLSNNSIADAAGSSGFPLGIAVSRTIQIELLNSDERYENYDFFGARIRLYLTFALSSTVEKIELGTFTVLEPETYGDTVIVIAKDDMYKAETAYKTQIVYPATLAQMFREICYNCDLPFGTSNFANSTFMVQTAPTGSLTHRQVLGYIAMIAGGNARVNREGDVEILSYDFGTLDAPLHTLNKWKNLKVDTSNIMITGLQTTAEAEEYGEEDIVYTFGNEGYMLSVENPLITGKEEEALRLMATGIVGVPFRKFSGDHIAYPLIEFMDAVEITDRKGKTYKSFVTDVNFVFFGITTLSNSAESALRNNSLYVAPETKAIIAAQKLVEKERSERETAIAQLNQKLDQAGGFFSTDVTQPDGSVIRYMHDKPTLEASANVIKITAEAIGFSTDGGKTYPYGLEVSGDQIVRILAAEGINADWITSGAFTIKDKNGNIVFSADADTGVVVFTAMSQTNEKVEELENQFTNLEIGGRNLFVSGRYSDLTQPIVSSDEWTDLTYDSWQYYMEFPSSAVVEAGQTYTFSVYVDREDKTDTTPMILSFGTGPEGQFLRDIGTAWWEFTPEGQRLVKTFAITEEMVANDYKYFAFRFRNEQVATTLRYKGLKLEKGNKVTDWTPSPEEVPAGVENELGAIRETITENYTSSINTAESIVLTALERYVETSNYEEFKQTLETQLSIMANEILMNFTTTTEQITNVDGDLQTKFTELYKYISFSGGTITLGSSDSAITLTIENDKIVFRRNGVEFGSWDGDYFYTGNIYVRVNESARFGNFAFLPRPDGSLMLQKVGG